MDRWIFIDLSIMIIIHTYEYGNLALEDRRTQLLKTHLGIGERSASSYIYISTRIYMCVELCRISLSLSRSLSLYIYTLLARVGLGSSGCPPPPPRGPPPPWPPFLEAGETLRAGRRRQVAVAAARPGDAIPGGGRRQAKGCGEGGDRVFLSPEKKRETTQIEILIRRGG